MSPWIAATGLFIGGSLVTVQALNSPSTAALRHSRTHAGGWFDPLWVDAVRSGTTPLLYVAETFDYDLPSATSDVAILTTSTRPPRLIGVISDLPPVYGIALDRRQNLYVCQYEAGAPVLVFAPGSTSPSGYLDTRGAQAQTIALADDGDVFVATGLSGRNSESVLVYEHGEVAPAYSLQVYGQLGRIAVDREEDAYFNYLGGGQEYYIGTYLKTGRERWRYVPTLHFPYPPFLEDISFDAAGNMVVLEQYAGLSQLAVYQSGVAHPTSKLPIPPSEAGPFAFGGSGRTLFMASGLRGYEYAYPSGGQTFAFRIRLQNRKHLPVRASSVAAFPAPSSAPRFFR
jgi:hypothetical protein